MYKALGDALVKMYPHLMWDEPKPESRLQKTRSQVYSAFIRRLSVARKVRKHRARKSAVLVVSPAPRATITNENAASELQALSSSSMSAASLDMQRMRILLTVTLPDRRNTHMDPLPQYFLVEEILCIEVELRFGSKITELENKLAAVVRVFSENEERECTLVDVMKHIQGNVGHSLICEMALPAEDLQVTAPHIYCTPEKICVFAGSQAELITVSKSGLGRALIFCLLTYYIKNLEYPFAFFQMLALVQKVVLPGDKLVKGLLSPRLKRLCALLSKKNVI
ncbi:uncharacterized protein LOC119444699 [Dermacentor silvarum]|nr:uncharacterized protein LOC119435105 [Dermacentor silvarum]XP_037564989.2 uncharacterized protein LOC119444699 [Dermacentor silvarum]XP_049516470.1 uncharacterized protein LOC119444699 [Dermacentor silvarum]